MAMIIGAKGLDEQQPFCAPELKELFNGIDGMAKGGMPPEVPAAIPLGQLVRITATLKKYRDLCNQAVAEHEKWVNADVDTGSADLEAVILQMKELLNVGPPIAVPQKYKLLNP